MGISLVERSVVMELCLNAASTWCGDPLLLSLAYRHLLALIGSAYAACREAAFSPDGEHTSPSSSLLLLAVRHALNHLKWPL